MKSNQQHQLQSQYPKYLLAETHKFNTCTIKNNYLNYTRYDHYNEHTNYVFEEKKIMELGKSITYGKQMSKEGKKGNRRGEVQVEVGQVRHLMDQLSFPNPIISKIGEKQNNDMEKDKEEDFNELWDMVQTEMKQSFNEVTTNENNKKQQHENQSKSKKQKPKQLANDSDSSFQLTPEQLKVLMQSMEQHTENEVTKQNNRNTCVYALNQIKTQAFDPQQKEDWGSWTDICAQLEGSQFCSSGQVVNKKQIHSVDIQNKSQNQGSIKKFSINESAPNDEVGQGIKQKGSIVIENYYQLQLNEKKCKCLYGPWTFNTQLYQLHSNCAIQYFQQLLLSTKSAIYLDKSLQYISDNVNRSLRKINWQMLEQKKLQNKTEQKKRNCKTNLLEHGQDFLIYDHYKFIYSAIHDGIHLYFGIRSYGNFSFNNESDQDRYQSTERQLSMKDFLYLSSNGQCLLETYYEKNQNNVDKFSIKLCLTKQTVAICQRLICNQFQDRRQFIEVRNFDRFQNGQSQYLGLIQSKISKFSGKWYCDTTIFIPKKKVYSKKFNEKNWDKLKMKLKVSEMGTIAAELGILVAKSSVTNCILLNESHTGQFMMGTIQQNCEETNYIVRIEGISPIMAFATAISRKFFVFSP